MTTRANRVARILRSKPNNNSTRKNSMRTPLGWQYGSRELVPKRGVTMKNMPNKHTPGELPNAENALRQSRYSIEASPPKYRGNVRLSPDEAKQYANIIALQLNTQNTKKAIMNLNANTNTKDKLWKKYAVNGYTNNNNNNFVALHHN
jgi:hypothetical protein